MIFNIQRFSLHDGPGIRTTVFFKGCPLRCRWCHNPESQQQEVETYHRLIKLGGRVFSEEAAYGRRVTPADLIQNLLRDLPFYRQSGGGVTFSGGEPLQQPEFLEELLAGCREAGITTAVDSSGYAADEVVKRLADKADLWLFDLKFISTPEHKLFTGKGNEPILLNLRHLASTGVEIRIRFPVIPGITDTESNLEAILAELERLPEVKMINLLPFHSYSQHKYNLLGRDDWQGGITEPEPARLQSLRQLFERRGYLVTVGG